MRHILNQKVFYSDTDAYGVVWHGSYLRWLEMGRVLWCEQLGYNLIDLQNQDIVLPVTNINIKYKAPAKLNDDIIIETYVEKFNTLSVTFKQLIKKDDKVLIEAYVDVVAVSNSGKLYRRMPELLLNLFERATNETK